MGVSLPSPPSWDLEVEVKARVRNERNGFFFSVFYFLFSVGTDGGSCGQVPLVSYAKKKFDRSVSFPVRVWNPELNCKPCSYLIVIIQNSQAHCHWC